MAASKGEQDDVAARRAKLIELRGLGLTFGEIARQIPGYRSASAAAQDWQRAMADTIAGRRARMLTARVAGVPFGQIAKDAGYAELPDAIAEYVAMMADRQAELAALAGSAVALEMERLDSLQRTAYDVMQRAHRGGDLWMTLRAIDRLQRLTAQRAILLGLNAETGEHGDRGERPEDVVDDLADRRRKRRAAAHR